MFDYNEIHSPVFNLKRKHLGQGDGLKGKAACGQVSRWPDATPRFHAVEGENQSQKLSYDFHTPTVECTSPFNNKMWLKNFKHCDSKLVSVELPRNLTALVGTELASLALKMYPFLFYGFKF